MADRTTLDPVDRALVRALQADGRASYADLAKVVGLSAPATRQRVQRLQEVGVLQVVAVTDPLTLGYPVMALLGIAVEGDVRAVADALGPIENVVYVVLTAGGWDLFAEVVCRSNDELFALVNDTVRALPGVRQVETFPYFDIHTHRFTWGVAD
jgi:Lrp/AsnC family transcriptional regulator for asnA, asnC and gidA